ncbi:MAG: hypothetical protein NUV84_01640, partial [Candidatus Uhrbacteria bacterium]|nr:hypothetical protein [Candidatus Uhrbacteria bacterium]
MRTTKLILHGMVAAAVVFYTLATALLAVPLTANAQTAGAPATIGYNGRLFNASGTALTGTYYFWVDLEPALTGGTNLGANIQGFADADGDGTVDAGETAITVTNGYFTMEVPITTDVADFNNQIWLELKVHTADVAGSAETLSPRVKVTKVPFAIVSQAIERSAADPTTGFEGRMYYDTDEDEIKFYDGTTAVWKTLTNSFEATAAGQDLTLALTGAFNSSVVISSTGTAADAMQLTTTAGGLDISVTGDAAGEDLDITTVGAATEMRLTSASTEVDAINLNASAGGITLTGALASADAININASNAAGGIDVDFGTGNMVITGTGVSADFTLDADLGSLDFTGTSNVTLTSNLAAEDFTVALAGATNSSLILSSAGTAADAMQITTTAGGLDISVTGDAAGEDLDITTVGDATEMRLTSASNQADAILLNASNAAGGIDINFGTGNLDIDGTGVSADLTIDVDLFSIDGTGTSNVTLTSNLAAEDFTIALAGATNSSLILSSTGTDADAMQITTTAGGL